MITGVVFDLDDTLYDEVDYCKSGFRAVADCLAGSHPKLDTEQTFQAFWSEFCSGNRRKVFNKALERLQIASDRHIIDSLVEVYRQHKPELELSDESRTVLEMFSKKYKLGLVTDGFMPAQQLKVEALGVGKYFNSIVYTELLGRNFWKPSTKGFEKVCKEISSPYEQSVYIADNLSKDFEGPNKLGFRATIKITRENHLHDFVAEDDIAKPDFNISCLSELDELLGNL